MLDIYEGDGAGRVGHQVAGIVGQGVHTFHIVGRIGVEGGQFNRDLPIVQPFAVHPPDDIFGVVNNRACGAP